MIDKFLKNGWCIIDIENTYIIRKIIADFSEFAGCELKYIHNHFDDDATKKLHIALSESFWWKEYSLAISEVLLPVIQQFIGPDVMVQYLPYLRIARPHKSQDNIGYHKDTQYGQTPYELAVHIPFVDLDDKSALRVISGSHVMAEGTFQKVTGDGQLIQKGSIENRTGRPYLPKRLIAPTGMQTAPLTVKVGQCALFSPAIFHGQEMNEGDVTRVSCDLRFVSSRAPFEIRKGKIHAGYVPISQSPIENIADKYYKINGVK